MNWRSKKLTQSAKNESCVSCGADDGTIVWAHSNEQNKWMRGFAADFGAHLGYSPDEAYELLMYKFCPEFITDPETGEEIRKPGHFSKKQDGTPRDTKEAAEIQEAVLMWAASLGFVWSEEAA